MGVTVLSASGSTGVELADGTSVSDQLRHLRHRAGWHPAVHARERSHPGRPRHGRIGGHAGGWPGGHRPRQHRAGLREELHRRSVLDSPAARPAGSPASISGEPAASR